MGIHNEPGTQKLPLKSTADLVDNMLSKITDTTDKDRSFVPFKHDGSDEVVLMVNDLGSISELEMGGITNEGDPRHLVADIFTADTWNQRSNGSQRRTSRSAES